MTRSERIGRVVAIGSYDELNRRFRSQLQASIVPLLVVATLMLLLGQQVTKRIAAPIRRLSHLMDEISTSVVCRLGGDEFAIIAAEAADQYGTATLAAQMLEAACSKVMIAET